MRILLTLLASLTIVTASSPAAAFCGFYVGGGDAKLFNEATQVVLMRHEDRTILSMQNNYKGPASDFAMVVPVPVVLKKKDVKTLPKSVFDRVDQMTAPRLVEYWEQDPCNPEPPYPPMRSMAVADAAEESAGSGGFQRKVKIEAQFKVAEYDIVVLSATESTALDEWLRQNKYNIPKGAEPYLRPYVEGGMYFFVARVIAKKVKYDSEGRATLSPLRFAYNSRKFQLPIRLGMINSAGKQDLLVYILAQNQRYDVANYNNIFIPTNLEVRNDVKDNFGDFYRALFADTLERRPDAVVTEYSWSASSCDPCPGPTLTEEDFVTLGADELDGIDNWGWTVTRLHAQYAKGKVGADLIFKKAPAVMGGREVRGADGALEKGATVQKGGWNNFQGRYIMRHEWSGAVACDNPQFGIWGGPPGQGWGWNPQPQANVSPNTSGKAPALSAKAKKKLKDYLKPKAKQKRKKG